MNAVFETACATLDWFIIVNGVTHSAFNDERAARVYYEDCVRITRESGVKRWVISLLEWNGEVFTDHDTFHT